MQNGFRQIVIFKVILLLLASCSKQSGQDFTIIDFESNVSNFKPVKLSELADVLEYIALETTPGLLLEEIKYLDISGDKIAVADKNVCLLFDSKGKFISQTGRYGNGPGEYTHISQIRIVNNSILIPDAGKDNIQFYNAEGEYLYSVKAPGEFSPSIHSRNFISDTDTTFFIRIPNRSGSEPYRIALFDKNGHVIQKYRNTSYFNRQKPVFGTSDVSAQFYKLKDKIYYKEMLNDTIWQIEDDNLRVGHVILMGKYGFSIKDKELPMPVWHKKLADECIDVGYVFECNRYIYFMFNFLLQYPFTYFRKSNIPSGKAPYEILGLYDKKEDNFFLVNPSYKEGQPEPTGIENDMDGGVNIMPRYIIKDTLMVSWVNAYELKIYVASNAFKNSTPKYPEKKKELEQLAGRLSENDNPVLMMVKLKN
jgi:hypothetical protein